MERAMPAMKITRTMKDSSSTESFRKEDSTERETICTLESSKKELFMEKGSRKTSKESTNLKDNSKRETVSTVSSHGPPTSEPR